MLRQHFRVVPSGRNDEIHARNRHPALNPSGDAGEFVGIVMDVTERKRGSALLTERAASWR